ARAGGDGGSILIRAGRGGLLLAPGAALRAGSGGATARAWARGGKSASAKLETPGAGGDVSLRFGGPATAASGRDLEPGDGGDAGLLGAISVSAAARVSAAAATPGGGDPGKAFVNGKAVSAGVGGDSSNVLARTDEDARYGFGEEGSAGTPGKPAAARLP
ncbi:MAG TPA: hypothetical protein VH309_03015, partial [Elusimicrobiota bacterium]|nr:hypothetical protein [Elusimicrobiota bacterium]